MPDRPRHPRQDLEALLREAERKGWRVDFNPRRGYWRLRRGCGRHQTWVHKTPSNPRYANERCGWLARETCWEERR